nr:MAG TPA: hypothetical protein [Caudoviricetes sp.]
MYMKFVQVVQVDWKSVNVVYYEHQSRRED